MHPRCKFLGKELEVGTWIQFSTNRKDLSEQQKRIYQADKYFFVISKEFNVLSGHTYKLFDIVFQKISSYFPTKNTINSEFLVLNSKVHVISKEAVEAKYGIEKVRAVYESAKAYLEKNKDV